MRPRPAHQKDIDVDHAAAPANGIIKECPVTYLDTTGNDDELGPEPLGLEIDPHHLTTAFRFPPG